MNTRNDNPNVVQNQCTKETEYKIIKESGCLVAMRKEPGGEWTPLERYRNDKKCFVKATFVTLTKAKRFIKKLQINATENNKKD